jgi:hypothetical protein
MASRGRRPPWFHSCPSLGSPPPPRLRRRLQRSPAPPAHVTSARHLTSQADSSSSVLPAKAGVTRALHSSQEPETKGACLAGGGCQPGINVHQVSHCHPGAAHGALNAAAGLQAICKVGRQGTESRACQAGQMRLKGDSRSAGLTLAGAAVKTICKCQPRAPNGCTTVAHVASPEACPRAAAPAAPCCSGSTAGGRTPA